MASSPCSSRLLLALLAAGVLAVHMSDAFGRAGGAGHGQGGRWVGGGSHHGGHHHHQHGGRAGWGSAWWGVGYWGPVYWGWPYAGHGYPWGAAYPYALGYPIAYPSVVVTTPGATAAPPRSVAAEWYYCRASGQFFPHAAECPAGWERVLTGVPPTTPAAPTPTPPQ